MTTLSIVCRARTAKWLLFIAPLLAMAGCGVDFDSSDQIKTLRVLAIQKDHPYAASTEDPNNPSLVNMTMLSHDGTPSSSDTPRAIQRLWFSGCDNLPGDQYFTGLARIYMLWQLWVGSSSGTELADGESWSPVDELSSSMSPSDRYAALQPVLQQVNPQLEAELARVVDSQSKADLVEAYFNTYRIGAGARFTYPIPPRIIENHSLSTNPGIPPYGLSFVFFTACAGHVDLAPEWKNLKLDNTLIDATLGFPLICLDDTGKSLGPDDYVAGYTQEFVYGDGSANLNPVIDNLKFNGNDVDPAAMCIDGSCVPEPPPLPCDVPSAAPRVPACSGKCPKYELLPVMDPNKNDDVDAFSSVPGSRTGEQMWIDYYCDRGKLDGSAKSVRDAVLGWFDDRGQGWQPPSDPGPAHLWAVVHDNRGGAAWARLAICVE